MRVPNRHKGNRDLQIAMTPMIDVVFLLLVFFVWTSSFQLIEMMMPTELSIESGSKQSEMELPPPEELDFENVVIRIKGDADSKTLLLNDQPVSDLVELQNRLARIASIKKDAPVIVYPDGAVPLGDVIDAYDVARLVGFESVQFAARNL